MVHQPLEDESLANLSLQNYQILSTRSSSATGQRRLFEGRFFGGGQNIKKRGVFAAAPQDVGPFFFYLFFIFSLFS